MSTFILEFEIPLKEIEDKITNLCRCGTYVRIKKAIKRSAELIENQKG